MLQALLQTLANLGFDAQAVSQAFNNVMSSVKSGDATSVNGLLGMFKGVLSAFTGMDASEVNVITNTLAASVMEMLSNAGASTVLSTITGA